MVHKLIIIGSGPAGYTAALYAARAELKPVVFTGESSGGQLMNTTLVENWPGSIRSLKSAKNQESKGYSPLTAMDSDPKTTEFEVGIEGPELMMNMREQAKKFGAEIKDQMVTKVELSGEVKKIWVGDEVHEAQAVIIATGAEALMLGVPGEKELMGKGVAVCAVCDAPFYKDKVTMVVGGGDAAIEDATALTKHASKVYLVHRRDEFRASKIMIKRAMENTKIEILWNTELKEVIGKDKVEKVKLFNNKDKREVEMETDGVFMAIGHKPATKLFQDQVELDEKGYIKTVMVYPDATKTNIEGVFAAGDVVDYRYQQAVTAAGMGCQAALDAEKWLEGKN